MKFLEEEKAFLVLANASFLALGLCLGAVVFKSFYGLALAVIVEAVMVFMVIRAVLKIMVSLKQIEEEKRKVENDLK